jgi:hypothetical protein
MRCFTAKLASEWPGSMVQVCCATAAGEDMEDSFISVLNISLLKYIDK